MTVDLYQTPLRYGTGYDEMSADGVTPRPHWAHLMAELQAIGPDAVSYTHLDVYKRQIAYRPN